VAKLNLIDTSAWIAFFKNDDPVASLVDTALADGSAAICGLIELELRAGIRPEERDRVLALIDAAHRLPTEEIDYARAGDLLAEIRRNGVTVPSTDGLIAHLAIKYDASLIEKDRHFQHFAVSRPGGG
jgi:predicted nucleic acid-binding protein